MIFDIGINEILRYADSIGTIALLFLIIFGGYRGWWVYGKDHKKLEQEKNDWRELALAGTELANRLTDVQERRVFGDKR